MFYVYRFAFITKVNNVCLMANAKRPIRPSLEARIIHRLVQVTGKTEREVTQLLIRKACRDLAAGADLLATPWEDQVSAPSLVQKRGNPARAIKSPQIRIVADALRRASLELTGSSVASRSTIVEIRALPGAHVALVPDIKSFLADDAVEINDGEIEPTLATVLAAGKRTSTGRVQFSISNLDESEPPAVFLTLLDEKRLWCVTRSYLRGVLERLEAGKRVRGFSLAKRGLHITLGRGASLYDLDQVIHRTVHRGHQ